MRPQFARTSANPIDSIIVQLLVFMPAPIDCHNKNYAPCFFMYFLFINYLHVYF